MSKKAKPITTASDAPDSTPKIPGSASGLRVTACMVPPAIASDAPASSPSTVRGSRATAAACSAVVAWPVSAARASSKVTARTPKITEATTTTSRNNARTASQSRRRPAERWILSAPGRAWVPATVT